MSIINCSYRCIMWFNVAIRGSTGGSGVAMLCGEIISTVRTGVKCVVVEGDCILVGVPTVGDGVFKVFIWCVVDGDCFSTVESGVGVLIDIVM